MAKTFTAAFAQTPKTASAVATSAVGSLNGDSPTNTILLATAGTDGAIFTKLSAIPRGTVTATVLYLWISKDSGTTKRLVATALMAAHTVATTTEIPVTSFSSISETNPIRLEAGDELYVGAGVALAAGIVLNGEWTNF